MVGGYGELAFQLGLLDEKQKAFVDSQSAEVVSHILKKDFAEAFSVHKPSHVSSYTTICIALRSSSLLN